MLTDKLVLNNKLYMLIFSFLYIFKQPVLRLGEWEAWTSCDKSCERGRRQRQRFCSTCVGGVDYEYEECNDLPCGKLHHRCTV